MIGPCPTRRACGCLCGKRVTLDGRAVLGYSASMPFERAVCEDAIECSARFLALRQLLEAAIADPRRLTADELKSHLAAKRSELAKQGL